ncbi:exodeoxyribonuclease V subunit beta [Pseudoxanthomonas sangjuensis]|uniref:exodeoxyribonuclease V subunit beta n=1 Tax=Pseudoxanthomonas sangjuensis TaxID=1503750 RepID=UPI001391763D|nr:exodeoxyribonuclease V subunit beta [Pseudoxanthomonas sangjuensis]KAF1714544.1 exodeoxyribonuclease V subunit beta [Pseudoxanthomonas sangjuensis]
MTARGDDSGLELELHGIRLIEASAGTGKTFALATLFVRLVVEKQLRIGQVLAVTFTEAATQELRRRIRERLALAAGLVGTGATADENPEKRLTRRIVERHLERSEETPAALQRRLRTAALEIDLASIFTIHGFCARVLREHALETGIAFAAPELLGSEHELFEALAADLWRVHAADAVEAEDLSALWSKPEDLAKDLPALVKQKVLLPEPQELGEDPFPRLKAAAEGLVAAYVKHGAAFFDALLSAIDGDVMNRNSYRRDWVEPLRRELDRCCAGAGIGAVPQTRLAKLTAAELEKGTKKAHAGKTPRSPLSPAVEAYLSMREACDAYAERRRIQLLHRIRAEARTRLAATKRERRVQSFDDQIGGVADALQGAHAGQLRRNLRRQYAIALVDEFQDTDERQWEIFRNVFGEAGDGTEPALFLIGDPKQAIYGFRGGDVHTYLAAKREATPAPPLSHNFRSRPGVLRAIDRLYEIAGKETAFDIEGIAFETVRPGGKRQDENFVRNGKPAPALTVRMIEPDAGKLNKQGELNAGNSRDAATRACVAAIHSVLSDARAGKASIDGEPVRPGDIAVLVRSHYEATRIRDALGQVGIPAVAAGKHSLFDTDEARDLSALLQALLQPGDPGRLRALLSTVLLGESAAMVAALETDENAMGSRLHALMQWRERYLRNGPFALVSDLCAANAQRLMGLLDGERRLSNYLQLGEQLQEAHARTLGLRDLSDWLQRRIAEADENDEAQQLRLESDARRVQIVTLHKSKGLEYPLVFLPYAGIGRDHKAPNRNCVAYDRDKGRELHWKAGDGSRWKDAVERWKREQCAEDARLLYVGLTRAEHALWIAAGPFYNAHATPLWKMLADRGALEACADIFLDDGKVGPAPKRLPPEADAEVAAAREPRVELSRDWWVYSFSQLSKADAGEGATTTALDESPAADEPEDDTAAAGESGDAQRDPRFAGTGYGSALHDALEHCDFAAWRGWRVGPAAPAGQDEVLREALIGRGFADDALDDGVAALTPLIGNALTATMPEGVRLCDVPGDRRRAEIEFHFSLQPTAVRELLKLLHEHGVSRDRNGFGARRQLEGLMTGKIDLTYFHGGRCYVLDWKSNDLAGDYAAAGLERAMRHSEYDLQALVYTVALHRWLRFRRGAEYDYERDFGGIRYLFCRGIDAARGDGRGIHERKFDAALVDGLDGLFGRDGERSAA